MDPDVGKAVLRGLDLCVVECRSFVGTAPRSSNLALLTPAPEWLSGPLSDLPFFDYFLAQADTAWHDGPHAIVTSEPFATTCGGEEVLLRATAVTEDGRRMLIIQRLAGAFDMRPMLQRAREQRLEHEQLSMRAEAVHAPVAALNRDIMALLDAGLPPESQEILHRLLRSITQLQAAAAPLPVPPRQRRQAKS